MDASKSFTYFIKAQTGDLERGFRKAGVESQQLGTKLDKLARKELDVREAAIKVEMAQKSAARATERYGKESLQAASAQVRLERAQQRATVVAGDGEKQTKKASGAMMGMAKSAAQLGVAYFSARGVIDGVRTSIAAYQDAEVSQKKLQTQLKASNLSYREHAAEIEKVIQKTSLLAGLDDEDLQDAFTNIVRVTGDVSRSLKLTGLAADFARAKHMDVAKAGEIVGKVAGGNTGILSRYGLSIEKGATASQALAILQQKFAGQAAAYGKTQAGAMDRLSVAIENLKEKVGGALAPALTKAANNLADFFSQLQGGQSSSRKMAKTVAALSETARDVAASFKSAERAVRPITSRVFPAVAGAASDVASVFRGLARTVRKVFEGDIGGAFRAFRGTVKSAMSYAVNMVKAGTAPMRAAGAAVGRALASGISSAFRGVTGFVSNIGQSIRKWLNDATPFGDTIKIGPAKVKIPALARGGAIGGGTPGKDSVPALLMPGEHVLTAKEVQRAGGHGAIFSMRRSLGGGGQSQGSSFASGGAVGGGTWSWARAFAERFGLRVTSSYRTPEQNRRAGGVANSWHTRGSAANPQAFDFVPPSQAAATAARQSGAKEVLIHNAGSGLHLHVGGIPSGNVGGGGGSGGGRVTVRGKGSWFGGPRDKMDSGKTASGGTTAAPGCAIRPGDHYNSGQPYLGGVWRITAPNGKSANIRQTDIGPNQSTGRRIDITYSALPLLGYTESTFPTDATFTATYLGKSATASRASQVKTRGFKQTGSSFDAARRRSNSNRGIRNNVNATRETRTAAGLDAALTLAGTTPGTADDVAAASAGYGYWDTKVRQYAYGLSHGDKRVTGEMLADAVQKRDGFSTANPMIASDVGGALYGTAGVAGSDGGSAANLAAALAENTAAMNANREHAKTILSTTGGSVITGLIAAMASTGIGSSFNLANQTAGRGAGAYASY